MGAALAEESAEDDQQPGGQGTQRTCRGTPPQSGVKSRSTAGCGRQPRGKRKEPEQLSSMPLADRSDTERAPAPQFSTARGGVCRPDHPGPFAPVSKPAFTRRRGRNLSGESGPDLGRAPDSLSVRSSFQISPATDVGSISRIS